MAPERPTSLVTGASAGIGAAFARGLAARGHDLILTARRTDRLERLGAELRSAKSFVTVLPADLADAAAPERLVAAIKARGLRVDWLVNNAGYGLPGTFDANPWDAHRAFLRVLVEAPSELAHRLLPAMRERDYGRIVNVASLAGFVPGSAGHTLYPAAKAYMIKFSQALSLENSDRDVNVCALCPGYTRSEFHDVTGTRERMEHLPGFLWQSAEAVVEEGIAAVDAGRPVRVTGRINRAIKVIADTLPDRIALALIARASRRVRNPSR